MGMYGDAPDPPDYGPMAEAQMELGDRSLDLMEEMFSVAREQSDRLFATTSRVSDAMVDQMNDQIEWAREDRKRYERVYKPMENKFAREATKYDSPWRRNLAAARAAGDVGIAYNQARQSAQRRLEGYGIDPSMLRSGALDLQSRMEQAKDMAGASGAARQQVEDTGRALRAAAIDMGRGLPASASTAAAGAAQSGGTGAGALTSGVSAGSGAMAAPASYGGLATAGYGGAVSALNTGYNNSLAAYEANQNYGLMGLLNTVGGGMAGAGTSYLLGMSEGGVIPEEASPSRGLDVDDVPTATTAGEYVVPRDVVRWKGEEFFERLKASAQKGMAERAGGQDGALPV